MLPAVLFDDIVMMFIQSVVFLRAICDIWAVFFNAPAPSPAVCTSIFAGAQATHSMITGFAVPGAVAPQMTCSFVKVCPSPSLFAVEPSHFSYITARLHLPERILASKASRRFPASTGQDNPRLLICLASPSLNVPTRALPPA